jgi:murein DD-endopeptidase MepM/ murein hydrolase activator NlpD
MKSLLLFLAGALVGANVVYFLVTRDCRPRVTAPVAVPVEPARATPAGNHPAATAAAVASAPPAPASLGSPTGAPGDAGAAATQLSAPTSAGPSGLLLPVAGVAAAQLTDTFNQTRDGTRRHEALDIMAARGTPVLAAADGKLVKLFTSVPGGLTIYEFDPSGTWAYYYAHLDHYAPGLAEGQSLKRGQVIGYVGSTGNASEEAPHLHFAIFVLGAEKQWWKGTAIDPFPLLTARR